MEAKAIIDSGRFGSVLCARGTYGKAGGLGFEKNWRLNKELAGGGILLDQGIHMLDLMRYLVGDFTQVKSFVENLYWQAPLEDNAFAIMKTAIRESGYGTFQCNAVEAQIFARYLFGRWLFGY